jgi:sporulation protein YlmC with PRC-barrel domain
MKHLFSGTALALLLATGPAFAADDAAQPNASPPNVVVPEVMGPGSGRDAVQSDQGAPAAQSPDDAEPNAAESYQARPDAAAGGQAAAPSDKSGAGIGGLPAGALPVSDYYNQSVYDTRDNKIGDVNDMLLDESGKINAVIVGVGGFLGVGEKNVAVPFSALKVAEKDGSRYLVLETTKEALQTAPGYIYDSGKKVWLPAPKRG